eukprot:389967-Karenia_brevis.AAC.1
MDSGLSFWHLSTAPKPIQILRARGSPLAGFLFALVLDCALHMMQQVIAVPSGSKFYACADDIGAAVT